MVLLVEACAGQVGDSGCVKLIASSAHWVVECNVGWRGIDITVNKTGRITVRGEMEVGCWSSGRSEEEGERWCCNRQEGSEWACIGGYIPFCNRCEPTPSRLHLSGLQSLRYSAPFCMALYLTFLHIANWHLQLQPNSEFQLGVYQHLSTPDTI